MSGLLEKPLPHNLDAERSILGAILMDNRYIAVGEIIKPQHFFVPQNQFIFSEMLAMHTENIPVDAVTLSERLTCTGKLEAAGGIAYLVSLTDGMPRVTNAAHYARIVHEKFELRDFIKETQRLSNRAWEGLASPADLRAQLEQLLKSNGNGIRPKLKAVDVGEFLLMNLRPIEYIVSPVFPVQGLVMVYAKRGRGKTFFMLTLCYAITIGEGIFGWTISRPRRVVYVDGEMPANVVQERLKKIYDSMDGRMPHRDFSMRLITPDCQEGRMPNISSGEGQRMIEDHLQEGDLLVLDNLSALSHGGKENEGESWDPVQEWLLQLRQRSITVTALHHAGKGGTQRGTSKREDLLDTVIALREPADYQQSEGARFEVHFEKLRRSAGGEQAFPFELRLDEDPLGRLVWVQRPLKDIVQQQCAEMLAASMSDRDIAETLHLTRYQVYRLKKKIASERIP